MIDLWNTIIKKEIPENENPNNIIDIVEKKIDLDKQQKGKERPLDLATRIKILTPKQMLQNLPIALTKVKAGKKSENLLKEIRQITYSFCRVKEITKKVYKNIMNSINL